MSARVTLLGLSALLLAVPLSAQERGTLEFGAFASLTEYDATLNIKNAWGAGGRLGAYLSPWLAIEFDGSGTRANRGLGLPKVNVGVLSAGLTATPIKWDRLSLLVGGGGNHTDTYNLESYGFYGLLGAKFAMSDNLSLRVDGTHTYMVDGKGHNNALRMGLSLYRHPVNHGNTVVRTEMRPAMMGPRADSVSAYETQRLRETEARYLALRDSLGRGTPMPAPSVSSAEALATMQERVFFENDKSDLSDSAKKILDSKVPIFRSNPNMKIVIVGHASQPGTEQLNMALGLRRAEASKAYLVSQGIDPMRIEIATRGEGRLAVEGTGEVVDAQNRRGMFRLLIADPYLVKP